MAEPNRPTAPYQAPAFAVAMLLLLAVGITMMFCVRSITSAGELTTHANQVIATAESLRAGHRIAETSASAFLQTGEPRFLREFMAEAPALRLGAENLADLISRDHDQHGRVQRLGAPLELIQIDHTPADVLVLSDDRQEVLGRPWVTVAIDVATRCVIGMYISMDAPSSVSVSLCIEHAVLPKPENETDPGVWPMYGKPKQILVDNGKDFRSVALQRGCDQHGIELTWRPVRTPHYGAHIERLIGTLMKIAHLLPGTTFSNVRERGDYDSAGKARLTLDEFRQWMSQKVCRYYHVRTHRSLGIPPLLAWERGLTGADGQFVAPPLMSKPLDFRMDFLPFVLRKVRRTGIEFQASRYWHDDVGSMLNSGGEAYPRAPGHVWVRRPDGLLVTAPAIGGRAAGEPTARRALDQATRAKLDAAIDAGIEATDQIEATANRTTRQVRAPGRRDRKPSLQTMPPPNASIGSLPPMAAAKRKAVPVEEWN